MAIQDLNTLSRVIISKRADDEDDLIDDGENIEEESLDAITEEGEGEEESEPKRKRAHGEGGEEAEDSGNDE